MKKRTKLCTLLISTVLVATACGEKTSDLESISINVVIDDDGNISEAE